MSANSPRRLYVSRPHAHTAMNARTHMHTHAHVYMHALTTHTCPHARMHTHTDARTHAHACACTQALTPAQPHTHCTITRRACTRQRTYARVRQPTRGVALQSCRLNSYGIYSYGAPVLSSREPTFSRRRSPPTSRPLSSKGAVSLLSSSTTSRGPHARGACVRARACVCACGRASVHAFARACMRACVSPWVVCVRACLAACMAANACAWLRDWARARLGACMCVCGYARARVLACLCSCVCGHEVHRARDLY